MVLSKLSVFVDAFFLLSKYRVISQSTKLSPLWTGITWFICTSKVGNHSVSSLWNWIFRTINL